MVGDCQLRPYIFPLDQHLDDKLPDGAKTWPIEIERQQRKGNWEGEDPEGESSQSEIE